MKKDWLLTCCCILLGFLLTSNIVLDLEAASNQVKKNISLYSAAKKGKWKKVEELLRVGVGLEYRDKNNRTALMFLSKGGESVFVYFLDEDNQQTLLITFTLLPTRLLSKKKWTQTVLQEIEKNLTN